MVTAIQTYKGESPTRVPSALALSVALHAAGLAAFLRISAAPPAEAPIQAIENVDLLVEEKEEKPAEAAKPKAPPPSMKDFLRLALPSVPKAMPKVMDAAVPLEDRKLMDMTPKLEDRGRMKEPQKLEALDMDRKRPTLAKLDAALPEERRPTRTLAALPKLEEVGGRQAPRKAIEAANLLEADRGRMQRAPLGSLGDLTAERRRPAAQPAALLPSEAQPATKPSALSRMADMLTSEENRISLGPRTAAAPKREVLSKMVESEPAPAPRRQTEAQNVKKKAVEIEGPLSNRRVTAHSIPHFPDWAREMGLVEAEVAIKFYVTPEGAVVGDSLRVERTSGYGRLDRLAMDHLKVWRFQAKAISGNEWGVITFRFLLE